MAASRSLDQVKELLMNIRSEQLDNESRAEMYAKWADTYEQVGLLELVKEMIQRF